MKFEKNNKLLMVLKLILSLILVLGLLVFKACPFDEKPMKCYWCLISLRISAVPLFIITALSFKLKTIEGKAYANTVCIILTGMLLAIILMIGVCVKTMVCAKIKQFTIICIIILFMIEIIHIYIINQMKKYSVED